MFWKPNGGSVADREGMALSELQTGSGRREQMVSSSEWKLAEPLSVAVLVGWWYRKVDWDASKRKWEKTSGERKETTLEFAIKGR